MLRGHALMGAGGGQRWVGGLEKASWRRCVWSQVCRGEMESMALGPAHLGLNLSFASFLLCELFDFTYLSVSRFLCLENELIIAPPHRVCLGLSELPNKCPGQDQEYS